MRDAVTYQAILDEGRAEGLSRGLAEGRADAASWDELLATS